MGGGSLMTPVLILLFGTAPTTAIGSDTAYAAVTKTVGGWRHLRLKSVKGNVEERPLYERWNSFSRIRVRPAPTGKPLGWGMSTVYRVERPVRQLILDIDGGASTVMTEFRGDTGEVEYLRHDVTSLAHYLKPGARVLAISRRRSLQASRCAPILPNTRASGANQLANRSMPKLDIR